MEALYLDDHTCRDNCVSKAPLSFKYTELEAGDGFNIEHREGKHIFFILQGRIKVRYNEFDYTEFGAGEMFFIPKSADCHSMALTSCVFIVHIYSNQVKICDIAMLESIVQYSKSIDYEFASLPINETLALFLGLMKTYLQEGVRCNHLHELKQQELFILYQVLYRKEDLAHFFFQVLGKSMDFRDMIMTHYPNVKTVRELAAACGYSEVRFRELFRDEFGQPPYKWMQKQMSNHIKGRLIQTKMPLKEIADEFNFSSPSHFSKYCKSQYGETPGRIREKLELQII